MSETITTLPNTIWKNVKQYPGYMVSSTGEIRKKKSNETMKTSNNHGYLIVYFYQDGKAYKQRIHRVVAEAFIGECPMIGWQINHKNGKTDDNRVENLEWVNAKQNMKHYYEELRKNGLKPKPQKLGIYNVKTEEWHIFDSLLEASRFFKIKNATMCSNAIDYHNNGKVYRGEWLLYKLDDDYEVCKTAYPTKI